MATAAAPARKARLPIIDWFLFAVRVTAIVVVLWGAFFSFTGADALTLDRLRAIVVAGISQGSVYALIALGYTMVYGVLGFINFAHGEVFMSGMMIGFFTARGLNDAGVWDGNPALALVITILASAATSTTIAVLLERIAYRPLRGAPRLIPLITSIGASFFLQYSFAGLFGTGNKSYPPMAALDGRIDILGLPILRVQLLVIVGAAAMMAGLWLLVKRTKIGKAMRAVAEDQEIARLMGINVDRTIVTVFAIGGAMAGVAGVLFALQFRTINFFSGFLPGIKAFASAVLGGIGNIVGAMLGGLVIGSSEAIGPQGVLEGLGIPATNQLRDVVAFIMLVLVLVFRPSGILGEHVGEERA
ncbi:MAG: branched-chain amino acid ABC transporter permease [Nitriliruptorales bacterium]